MRNRLKSKKFYSRLVNKAYRMKFPLRVMFELTHRCNLKCRHCYNVPSDEKELNTKEVFSILRQLKNIGCFYLGFTGGEIFLRKDIFDILWQAKKFGFSVAILTNATLIDEKKASLLAEINLNKIDISLHGAIEKTYEYITRIKGSFRKCMNAIYLLRQRKIPIYLKTNLMTVNFNEFGEIKKLAEQLKLHFRYDPALTPRSNGSKQQLKLRIEPEKIIEIKRKYFPHFIENQRKHFLENCDFSRNKPFFSCGAGRTEATINPYGRLKVCLEMPYPNYDILKGSLKDGWQEVVNFVDSIKPSSNFKCKGCKLLPFCRWCPAKGLLEMGDMNSCVPYFKELAKREKALITSYS